MSNIRSTNVVRVTYDQIGCDNISISIIVTVASDIYLMNRGLDLSLLTIKAIESNRIMLQFFQREREREREREGWIICWIIPSVSSFYRITNRRDQFRDRVAIFRREWNGLRSTILAQICLVMQLAILSEAYLYWGDNGRGSTFPYVTIWSRLSLSPRVT
jgi:hypothetical protein